MWACGCEGMWVRLLWWSNGAKKTRPGNRTCVYRGGLLSLAPLLLLVSDSIFSVVVVVLTLEPYVTFDKRVVRSEKR